MRGSLPPRKKKVRSFAALSRQEHKWAELFPFQSHGMGLVRAFTMSEGRSGDNGQEANARAVSSNEVQNSKELSTAVLHAQTLINSGCFSFSKLD